MPLFYRKIGDIDMSTTTTRPFKVLGIQQIAIGGTDKQRMKTLWVDMFGLT